MTKRRKGRQYIIPADDDDDASVKALFDQLARDAEERTAREGSWFDQLDDEPKEPRHHDDH
jgi:hypothetical protein